MGFVHVRFVNSVTFNSSITNSSVDSLLDRETILTHFKNVFNLVFRLFYLLSSRNNKDLSALKTKLAFKINVLDLLLQGETVSLKKEEKQSTNTSSIEVKFGFFKD